MKIKFKDGSEIELNTSLNNLSLIASESEINAVINRFKDLEKAEISDDRLKYKDIKATSYVIIPLGDEKYQISINVQLPDESVMSLIEENNMLKNDILTEKSKIEQKVADEVSKIRADLNDRYNKAIEEVGKKGMDNKELKDNITNLNGDIKTLVTAHKDDDKERVAIMEAIAEIYSLLSDKS